MRSCRNVARFTGSHPSDTPMRSSCTYRLSCALVLSTVVLLAACGGHEDEPDFSGTGGEFGSGAGASPSIGGSSGATGGSAVSGGAASGGRSDQEGDGGGEPAGTGGVAGSGGLLTTGGAGGDATGGGENTGGTPNAGGSASTGGGTSTGGDASTGGGAATGGASGGECNDSVRPAQLEGYGRQTTGGEGGSVVVASTGTEVHAALCSRASEDTPLVILIDGTITPGNTTKQSGSCNTADGVIELKEISNLSLIGVGSSGVLDQIGVHIRSSSNIVIQNLTIKNVRKSNTDTPSNGGDAIGVESDVDRLWIDHNEIYGSTTEGEEHDGLIDFKVRTTNVTVSYNYLHDSGRGGLIGSNDDGDDGSNNITFHHNWYQNINSRTHLVREVDGHFYNNYYDQILDTGINCRNGASLLIDGNYFENSRNPLGTFFFVENPGTYEVAGNYFAPSVEWEASSDKIPAGPNVQSTGSVTVPYDYALDQATCVPAIVRANAGVGKL